MIDVHIAHMPEYRQDWWEECQLSLQDHPITIHHIDGIPGDVRQMRLNGYNMGTHDYVSFVDPDDIVMPGAFEVLLEVLTSNPDVDGVYSLSDRITDTGRSVGLIHPYREYDRSYLSKHIAEIHQLTVMRRDAIVNIIRDNFNDIPPIGYTEITTFAMFAMKYQWKAVDHVGYKWRVHANGAHNQPYVERKVSLDRIKSLHDELTKDK